MIVRILIAAFTSLVGTTCFLSGMNRLMGGLLIGFGMISAILFGVLFTVPAAQDLIEVPLYGQGGAMGYFGLSFLLAVFIVVLFLVKPKHVVVETVSKKHFIDLGCGMVCYIVALFLPALFWFPSESARAGGDVTQLQNGVLIGTFLFLVLVSCGLVFFFRASRGGTGQAPHMMRKMTLVLFSFFHLDKLPFLVAYLLVYSPETGLVFPRIALLALSAYLLEALFLILVSRREINGQ